ncbi:MAG TPA: hypothetical protein VMU50_14160 [Polyangia bacterium]|nr:hypothetical protein [Polyangia bacterium]
MKKLRALASLMVLPLGVAIGCGGGSSLAGNSGASQFVGDWRWDSGELDVDCAGMRVLMQDLTGMTFAIVMGTASNEIVATLTPTCPITLAVSGGSATAEPDKTMCTLMANGQSQVVTVSTGTLTPTGSGGFSVDFKGTAVSGLCVVTGSGTVSRPADAGT